MPGSSADPAAPAASAAEALRRRALAVLPGGVSSNVRALEQDPPLFIRGASGARVRDEDGREYVDHICGFGAVVLGYAPPGLNEAVARALAEGIQHAAASRAEVEVAEALRDCVPSMEMSRFHGSATEALQTAFRLARAATGRPTIVKFARHYHGWVLPSDAEIAAGAAANAPAGFALLPWNDPAAFDEFMRRRGAEVAAVVTEPFMANQGCHLPAPGWLDLLQERSRAAGALFVLDETVTGFRLALGGAQALYGLAPDLSVFGKGLCGGPPVGVVGGRAGLMRRLVPGGVGHGGTFNGNGIAMAAALWSIAEMRRRGEALFRGLERTGQCLMRGLEDAARAAGRRVVTRGPGAVFWLAFAEDDPTDAEPEPYRRFRLLMRERGVRLGIGGRWYVSAAHGEDELRATLDAARAAFAAMA